ncbi:MAG: hypothetical protein PHY08_12725 [Candidatus Cloacimonetes bacterium]|nr:hypothetical protein [Candidatus Cloacimonadota bacterium]
MKVQQSYRIQIILFEPRSSSFHFLSPNHRENILLNNKGKRPLKSNDLSQ